MNRIEGKDKGKVTLYALSTCGWCRKAKALLHDLGVAYEYEDVDRLEGEERKQVLKEVERRNPALSFPLLVINDSQEIIGFNEDRIRAALA